MKLLEFTIENQIRLEIIELEKNKTKANIKKIKGLKMELIMLAECN